MTYMTLAGINEPLPSSHGDINRLQSKSLLSFIPILLTVSNDLKFQ